MTFQHIAAAHSSRKFCWSIWITNTRNNWLTDWSLIKKTTIISIRIERIVCSEIWSLTGSIEHGIVDTKPSSLVFKKEIHYRLK